MHKGRSPTKKRDGSALVEFALVTVLLMVLMLVTIQYGIILNTMTTLTHLAREGARYAATAPQSDDNIKQRILSIAPPQIQLQSSDITVTPTDTSQRITGSPITVTIVYDMRRRLFLPSVFLGVRIFSQTITVRATARIE